MKRNAVKPSTSGIEAEIIKRIRSHPDPERACVVVMGIMEMIDEGADLNQIKTRYRADLAAMKKGAKG